MKKYLAQAAFQSSYNENKYSMYIGRWQPWHAGHWWLIDQRLEEGKNVWIAIREIPPDEKNPWTAEEVLTNLERELKDLIEQMGAVVLWEMKPEHFHVWLRKWYPKKRIGGAIAFSVGLFFLYRYLGRKK